MAGTKQPIWRFTLKWYRYPASAGILTLRWSTRPLADDAAFSEGRLVSIGDFNRAATDQDGNYQITSLKLKAVDYDGRIRGLLNASTTEYITYREGILESISEDGRTAGLDWQMRFRGVVTACDIDPDNFIVDVTVTDPIGTAMSGMNLDRHIGIPISIEDFANMDKAKDKKFIFPIVLGEVSDFGAKLADGITRADLGMYAPIDVGDYRLDGTTAPPITGAPPTITSATVVGTPGGATYTYSAILVTPYGYSSLGNIVTVTGAPSLAEMNITRYVDIRISFDPGNPLNLNQVLIAGRSSNPPATYLDEIDYIDQSTGQGIYFDGAKADSSGAATRDEKDDEKGFPTGLGTAIMDDGVWTKMVVSIGTLQEIRNPPYASNLAEQDTPSLAPMDTALEGVEYILPTSPQWVDTNKFGVTPSGIQYTYFWMRGLRVKAMRDGSVGVFVNVCGYEATGDGSGEMVGRAFPAMQLFFNEFLLKNKGTGYRSGNWGPLETFSNGDSMLKTSAFAACQATTVNWIGNLGYLVGFVITQQMDVREIIQRLCITFGCRFTTDHQGQTLPLLIDDLADATVGRLYAYRERIETMSKIRRAEDEVENKITFAYDFSPRLNKYRMPDQPIQDATSIAASVPGGVVGDNDTRGERFRDQYELFCTRDRATAYDSMSRRLSRNKRTPTYATITSNMQMVEDDIGSQIRVSHPGGLGTNGYVAQPMITLGQNTSPMNGTVSSECFDMGKLLGVRFAPNGLQDNTGLDAIPLGDRTSIAMPPTGAWELR